MRVGSQEFLVVVVRQVPSLRGSDGRGLVVDGPVRPVVNIGIVQVRERWTERLKQVMRF